MRVNGGPHNVCAPPARRGEAKCRIMESGVKSNKRFVLREANNLAPYTPVVNIAAMYEACKEYGKY